jgi:hypothetical protein
MSNFDERYDNYTSDCDAKFDVNNQEHVLLRGLDLVNCHPDFAWKCEDEDYLQLVTAKIVHNSMNCLLLYAAFQKSDGHVVAYAFDFKPFIEMLDREAPGVVKRYKDKDSGEDMIGFNDEDVPVLYKRRNDFGVSGEAKRFFCE